MKAVGCHVFAGGFTMGVREVCEVDSQLEIHGLGKETVEAMGVPFVMGSDWHDWPRRDGHFLYGNPRCTGFSCMSAGCGEHAHGAWSRPTRDIHQLMEYGLANEFPVIIWESVQQAYSVGKPLLDWLRDEKCRPKGYRVAHLFINAATFGNAQRRKRYFFVAYQDDLHFNFVKPRLVERQTTVGDVLLTDELLSRPTWEARSLHSKKWPWDADAYDRRTADEKAVIPVLPKGWDLNAMARHNLEGLRAVSDKYADTWEYRNSDMPFSMHSIARLHDLDYMPVVAGDAARFIHPTLNRSLTVREIARLMGWPAGIVPVGESPVGQVGKGVCPEVGRWLAEQVQHCVNRDWGHEDWESSYDHKKGQWVGRDFTGHLSCPPEKVMNLTSYAPKKPVLEEVA